MPWHQAVHEYIVKKLLDSPGFHRFVRVTNARLNGHPVPPRDHAAPTSPLVIQFRKMRVFAKLFAEEFKNVLTGKS
jgi:hypothetical protein